LHTNHAIDYFEFTVRDLAAAKRFYADAFGWTFNDYGPEYAGIRGREGEHSHWRLIGEGQGLHWPDLDEDVSVEGLLRGRA
jgi:catechol 2,3-dioxygenase-like lactoylglutathione lyase family enzyme